MKKFLKSNTFYIIVSISISILLWIYVAYEVNPGYEMKIGDVTASAINVSTSFNDGKLKIADENNSILANTYEVDIKVKGKRNVVSSIDKDDINCSFDLSMVDKAGTYTLRPNVEISKSGIELISTSPSYVTIKVENIEQRILKLELLKTGKLPDGYVMHNENYNENIQITGSESIVKNISHAYIKLNCSELTPDDSEKTLNIVFVDKDGNEVDNSAFTGVGRKDEKLTFNLYTRKEVTVLLRPQYKDMKKENNRGQLVLLSAKHNNSKTTPNGGVELKVTLEGTAKALEKYVKDTVEVYTEAIDVSEIYGNCTLDGKYKAAELYGNNIKYITVPEVVIEAKVVNEDESEKIESSVVLNEQTGEVTNNE